MRTAPPPFPRESVLDAVRSVPRITKVVVGVISVVVSLGTTALGAFIWVDHLATEDEVRAVVAAHNHQPRAVEAEANPHPPIAKALAGVELRLASIDQELRDARRSRLAVFEHLVSLQAADVEVDRRRKMEAARVARAAYREALATGAAPEDAANIALDTRMPWTR